MTPFINEIVYINSKGQAGVLFVLRISLASNMVLFFFCCGSRYTKIMNIFLKICSLYLLSPFQNWYLFFPIYFRIKLYQQLKAKFSFSDMTLDRVFVYFAQFGIELTWQETFCYMSYTILVVLWAAFFKMSFNRLSLLQLYSIICMSLFTSEFFRSYFSLNQFIVLAFA